MAEDTPNLKEAQVTVEYQTVSSPPAINTKTPTLLQEKRSEIVTKTTIKLFGLVANTIVLASVLGSIYLIHLILQLLFGPDAKFFNYLPISWIIDVADVLAIAKFLWAVVRDFREPE